MLTAVKRTGAWKFARGVKRRVSPPRVDALLPAGQCRSRVTVTDAPVALEAGQRFGVSARLENLSGVAYATAGDSPVSLRAGWRTPAGGVFDGPTADIPLIQPVYPGEPQDVTLPLVAPAFVGDFTLHIDFVQKTVFSDRNPESVPGTASIPVQGKRSTDIDYHAVYRTADLDANHWWVVGAYHSKEQYERSSRDRMDTLRKHGLTPDSRVLDVGCGTGQMAGPLMPYLTDRGAYYGTDIGAEAVAYCDRTFRRRNFVFKQGGMTTVPFDAADGPFDLAIFFSVFTHTFPDETALLLGETCRLLAPTGCVIADVIVSPLVERGLGHRGEMVLNRTHFERLAGMLGLHADVIGRWEWNRHAERLMYRLRRG